MRYELAEPDHCKHHKKEEIRAKSEPTFDGYGSFTS
jgi:hypothetical protein